MKKLLPFIGISLLLVASCTEEEKRPYSNTEVKSPAPVTVGQNTKAIATVFTAATLRKITPIQFIDSLKAHVNEGFVTVDTLKNWVDAKDILPLMQLIKNRTECAGVKTSISNSNPPGNIRSTIGVEAMMLIEGFRDRYYPTANTSVDFSKGMQMNKDKKLVLYPNPSMVLRFEEWFEKDFR